VNRLRDVFAKAKAENRAALIGYLPAGFPTVPGAIAAIKAMLANGVDAVEIGMPYSDPVMDGATIQHAVQVSLATGTTISDLIESVRQSAADGAAILVMSYWNPIERYGVERFATEFAAAGGSGVITPDLTPEEATSWLRATNDAGIDRVFLVAPSSSAERLAKVTSISSGFVYAASTMGVTGTRNQVSDAAQSLVARTRAVTDLPIAVGLGVSNAAQAAELAAFADGVIVGSAFVRLLIDSVDETSGVVAVGRLAAELAVGVRQR
jgi:tryptophan synthase alpha chain